MTMIQVPLWGLVGAASAILFLTAAASWWIVGLLHKIEGLKAAVNPCEHEDRSLVRVGRAKIAPNSSTRGNTDEDAISFFVVDLRNDSQVNLPFMSQDRPLVVDFGPDARADAIYWNGEGIATTGSLSATIDGGRVEMFSTWEHVPPGFDATAVISVEGCVQAPTVDLAGSRSQIATINK